MITIAHAIEADIASLVALESALFHQDAAVHDPFSDPTWPEREGHEDFQNLIASPDGIVLVARTSDEVVGLLVGYAAQSSPTRQPVDYATLRTMYVTETARRAGIATMLTQHFVGWARQRGCVEAHVDHYAANTAAGALYERCGFSPRSISRVLSL